MSRVATVSRSGISRMNQVEDEREDPTMAATRKTVFSDLVNACR